MSMSRHHDSFDGDDLAAPDRTEVQVISEGAVGALVKSEVEAQLAAAHKYPRSIKRFLQEAMTLATQTTEIAEACIYSLPRDGKTIAGPSVRLAEIAASAYGNMHFGARIVDEQERKIVAQGAAWDLEKNNRATIEVSRRITGRNGRRYSDDMVTVTGNAAASIALRNAIFRVIPRAYIDQIYARVRLVAVGKAETLVNRRAEVLARLVRLGVTQDRVFATLGVKGIEDIGIEQLEVMIGLGTAIKSGELSLDEAFPPLAPAPAAPEQDGKRISMRWKKSAPAESPPAAETVDPETGEVTEGPRQREPGED